MEALGTVLSPRARLGHSPTHSGDKNHSILVYNACKIHWGVCKNKYKHPEERVLVTLPGMALAEEARY